MFFPPEWVTDIRRARPRADLVGYGGCDDFGFLFSFFTSYISKCLSDCKTNT